MALCVSFDFDGPSPYLWNSCDRPQVVVGELEQRRFGPRVGVWRILDVLGDLAIKGSFFIPGAIVDAHPDAVEAILAGGHEVGLHGYMHERVEQLTSSDLSDVLNRSVGALARIGGVGPFGYRSPSWEMTVDAWSALRASKVAYDSSLMGSDVPYVIDGLVEVPVEWALDDAVFYRFTPGTIRPPVPPRQLLETWIEEIEAAKRYGSLVMLTMHPWISGRAGRAVALRSLLERCIEDPQIWLATAGSIAAHHRAHYGLECELRLRPGEI
jgi:peptidoglycan/xylan/chitin deacetylase (PgdA/CDA1 family)